MESRSSSQDGVCAVRTSETAPTSRRSARSGGGALWEVLKRGLMRERRVLDMGRKERWVLWPGPNEGVGGGNWRESPPWMRAWRSQGKKRARK